MNSVNQDIVFRQYLALLPKSILACPSYNYNYRKMTDESVAKAFLLSKLFQWKGHEDIELAIRSEEQIQGALNVDSISASQLSRRLRKLDTSILSEILGRLVFRYWRLKSFAKGLNPTVGLLRIIDSSFIKLPNQASDWTAVSKDSSGVKLHLRLAVASSDSVFPEDMIPSTSNIADIDAVNYLINADDATYVMDRGYGEATKMGGWLERGVKFLVRIKKTFQVFTLKELDSGDPNVTRHAIVSLKLRNDRLKLVEFTDKDGTFFRILTNRLDLTEQEIMDTYKSRWYIELFFKWMKQNIKVDHLYSQEPIGIWNQLFLTLIHYGLLEILRLQKQSKKTIWSFLKRLRKYLLDPWDKLDEELNRPKKKSKGRQKVPGKIPIQRDFGVHVAIVNPISKEHFLIKP
ncbi:IS4 family transposase [Pseudogracilibacillus auburnensis]|uniref:IS4 family transposase n=1 Tax=Pseudogracilibacillus auburnensis TaxID=1494959 RepID=UPI001A978ADE|nr:IS4 family transposase [Pseudogracilibacillus auburnensis]MBO1006023.1 IS4 family transposase [Pseudogracilibacillus auburnensis]